MHFMFSWGKILLVGLRVKESQQVFMKILKHSLHVFICCWRKPMRELQFRDCQGDELWGTDVVAKLIGALLPRRVLPMCFPTYTHDHTCVVIHMCKVEKKTKLRKVHVSACIDFYFDHNVKRDGFVWSTKQPPCKWGTMEGHDSNVRRVSSFPPTNHQL